MKNVIEQMLEKYDAENISSEKNAIKEIMQEIVLCGLSRAGFFKKAAFYGGTALRIFYGLDRFSEDLDFSLKTTDLEFDIKKYFPVLEKEIKSFGLNVDISEKIKSKESDIRSAFIKGNTKEHLLLFYPDKTIENVANNEVIRIKFEVDVNPPQFATYEYKYRLFPTPYEVQLYDMPSLFAGKLHAVICRAWKNRVKGRDLYDYIFYLSKGTKFNLKHLNSRLVDSGFTTCDKEYNLDEIKEILYSRFKEIDFEQAKQDVKPFIKDISVLNIWSLNFFNQITNDLQAE